MVSAACPTHGHFHTQSCRRFSAIRQMAAAISAARVCIVRRLQVHWSRSLRRRRRSWSPNAAAATSEHRRPRSSSHPVGLSSPLPGETATAEQRQSVAADKASTRRRRTTDAVPRLKTPTAPRSLSCALDGGLREIFCRRGRS